MDTELGTFEEILKVLRFSSPRYENIFMDEFKTDYDIVHTYLVIIFKGGAMSVKNCDANSLSANLLTLSQIMNGGYYKEVDEYKRLKDDSRVRISIFKNKYYVSTFNDVSDLLVKKVKKAFEETNEVEISFGVTGRTCHEVLSHVIADKMPEYDFEIGYNYKCIARKKENK